MIKIYIYITLIIIQKEKSNYIDILNNIYDFQILKNPILKDVKFF